MESNKFTIDTTICISCGGCASVCPVFAIAIREGHCAIGNKCIACGNCALFCPLSAINTIEKKKTE